MLEIFEKLSMALYGNSAIAITAAFLWGVLSIVLSPCHLASIPIVIAFINEQQELTTRKAFLISTMFSAGILITLIAAGMISIFIGLLLGTTDMIIRSVVIVLLITMGLYFLGVIRLPDIHSSKGRRIQNRPYLSGLVLGLVFGLALGPCALAFMSPIMGIVMQSITTQTWFCLALMLAYILGHSGIIIAAGTFTEFVKKYLSWNFASKGTKILRIVCGILILISALIMLINLITGV